MSAEQARDQARTDLRNAVLDYLLSTGQLRVNRDGSLDPIPGMQAAPAVPADPVPADQSPSDAATP